MFPLSQPPCTAGEGWVKEAGKENSSELANRSLLAVKASKKANYCRKKNTYPQTPTGLTLSPKPYIFSRDGRPQGLCHLVNLEYAGFRWIFYSTDTTQLADKIITIGTFDTRHLEVS